MAPLPVYGAYNEIIAMLAQSNNDYRDVNEMRDNAVKVLTQVRAEQSALHDTTENWIDQHKEAKQAFQQQMGTLRMLKEYTNGMATNFLEQMIGAWTMTGQCLTCRNQLVSRLDSWGMTTVSMKWDTM